MNAHRAPRRPIADLRDDELLTETDRQEDAFAEFYRRHCMALAAYFLSRTRNREMSADLTAETFAAALQHRDRFDPTAGTASQWLFGIARHKLGSALERHRVERRARRRIGIPPLHFSDVEMERVEELAGHHGLLDMVDELPAPHRAALLARVVEEREYAEIARAHDVTEAATRQRVSRALAQLRRRAGGGLA